MNTKPYVRPFPRYSWWLTKARYVRYMTREITSLFIAAYTGLLVIGLGTLADGKGAWDAYLAALQSPMGVAFHAVAFAFAVYHSATWFNVTPKAMPIEIAGKRLPDIAIIGAHYAVWVVVSAALFLLSVGG
ncbi:MAG: fumarate reductase subunit C [Rhodospirillales bacterium]|nr:fumarate reductase subunit C [Rhodospirillales bacterium]